MAAFAHPGLSRNRRLFLVLSLLVIGMIGLAYASAPLYRWFCQVTGYGGTTQISAEAPTVQGLPPIAVRFNADVNRDLPWAFYPLQRDIVLPIGETALIFYRAENKSSTTITGTATFNVTPHEAGQFFAKIECFCFTEQTLAPGQSVEMPVRFYVDPAILDHPDAKNLKTITLSYTFFRAVDDGAAE